MNDLWSILWAFRFLIILGAILFTLIAAPIIQQIHQEIEYKRLIRFERGK